MNEWINNTRDEHLKSVEKIKKQHLRLLRRHNEVEAFLSSIIFESIVAFGVFPHIGPLQRIMVLWNHCLVSFHPFVYSSCQNFPCKCLY